MVADVLAFEGKSMFLVVDLTEEMEAVEVMLS